jgi:hypothetical protein
MADIPFCLATTDASRQLPIEMFLMLMQYFDWEQMDFKQIHCKFTTNQMKQNKT